ncbi:MAG: hypothetical protein ACRD8A_12795 [Candidatus Acidiferrales bacterium]
MPNAARRREWLGVRPRKRGWIVAREAAEKEHCEHCGQMVLYRAEALLLNAIPANGLLAIPERCKRVLVYRFGGAVDHLVPERLILQFRPDMNPHHPLNLMTLAVRCHAIKTQADARLCRGDKLGFLDVLRKHDWPMERIEAALALYQL